MDNHPELKVACRTAAEKFLKARSSNQIKYSRFQSVIQLLKKTLGVLLFIILLGIILHKIVATTHIVSFLRDVGVVTSTDLIYWDKFRLHRYISIVLSLHKLQLLHDVNTHNCLLVNPFFERVNPSCEFCKDLRQVVDVSHLSSCPYNLVGEQTPFLNKGTFPTPINLEGLKQLITEDETFGVSSFPSEVDSHLNLETIIYNMTRKLRNFIPGPERYVPKGRPVHFHKHLIIDGPSSPSYSLPKLQFRNVFILQAHGRRLIKLLPIRPCTSTCAPISIVLTPGDILFYGTHFWNAVSEPVPDGGVADDISILNIGSYTFHSWEYYV